MKFRKSTKHLFLATLFCALNVSAAFAQQPATLTAQQILDQAKAAYAQCESYMDTGNVKTVFVMASGRRTVVKPFNTAFVRPAAFRFEFQERRGEEEFDRYIVWQEGAAVKSFWTMNQAEKDFPGLEMALAGPTGVSGGSANFVPSLLLPDTIRGGMVRNLSQAKLAGEEEVEGIAAYKLEATDLRGKLHTLWIDKTRSVILKMFAKAQLESKNRTSGEPEKFETETTTTYYPAINVPIPPGRLKYGKDLPKSDGQ